MVYFKVDARNISKGVSNSSQHNRSPEEDSKKEIRTSIKYAYRHNQ